MEKEKSAPKYITACESAGLLTRDGMASSIFITCIAIGISLFHLYTSAFGALLAHRQRLVHLTVEMVLAFLIFSFQKNKVESKIRFKNWSLAIVPVFIIIYVFWNYESLIWRVGNPTSMDVFIGSIYLILVLEATRRVVGSPLVIIAVIFLAYTFLGPYIPGIFGHRGIKIPRLADHMFMSTEGIFSIPLGVSASYIFIFVLFGSFLEITKGGEFFLDLALSIAGRRIGGPAKTAVLSSALMGTISGSSIANTVATGTFTIPLMIKSGYKKHFAAAVEAAASTGGQIMPPVMGAAAFIMIEYTRIPYTRIMLSAMLPAVIYFFGVYVSVHLEAKRVGLKGIAKDDLPVLYRVLRNRGYLLLPVLLMIWLLVRGQTPMKAGAYAIAFSVIIGLIMPKNRITFFEILSALRKGAMNMVPVALACATAGVIAGSISLTGIGLKIASFIEVISAGNLFVALALTMVACLILGMGLPTVATYIVLVTIIAPALTNLGVPLLAAHLFVFYFGVVADITPPVALAAYAGAGIAGANQFKTGVTATGIAAAGFLVPYVFVYSPSLLLSAQNGLFNGLISAMPVFTTSLIGVVMLGGAITGFFISPCRWYEKIVLIIGALSLIKPGLFTDLIGLFCLISVIILQIVRIKTSTRRESYEYRKKTE
jgi:TRAP transporter 4TM/12TM fusion protein